MIEWAVYQRPPLRRFKAEPYCGTRHLVAVALSEKSARAFADSQNAADRMQERLKAADHRTSRGG